MCLYLCTPIFSFSFPLFFYFRTNFLLFLIPIFISLFTYSFRLSLVPSIDSLNVCTISPFPILFFLCPSTFLFFYSPLSLLWSSSMFNFPYNLFLFPYPPLCLFFAFLFILSLLCLFLSPFLSIPSEAVSWNETRRCLDQGYLSATNILLPNLLR